jgi:TfoX/Sxy family transcriptional regulator of competence genes
MAYDQTLANRIREQLQELQGVEEKEMMGGICFMLNDKMCVGIVKDEMMCRIDPALYGEVLEKPGCREMDFTGRPMKGWVLVGSDGLRTVADMQYWIGLSIDYNKHAKSSKKKK